MEVDVPQSSNGAPVVFDQTAYENGAYDILEEGGLFRFLLLILCLFSCRSSGYTTSTKGSSATNNILSTRSLRTVEQLLDKAKSSRKKDEI